MSKKKKKFIDPYINERDEQSHQIDSMSKTAHTHKGTRMSIKKRLYDDGSVKLVISEEVYIDNEYGYGSKWFNFPNNITPLLDLHPTSQDNNLMGLRLNYQKDGDKVIDKKAKISDEEFTKQAIDLVGNGIDLLSNFLKAKNLDELPETIRISKNVQELRTVVGTLNSQSINNCVFDPTLMRGFDYYTGIVFEVFDLNPINIRSLFGGGRYDNLVDLFGVESVPAVGFGMGDVTIQDFLETYNLIPKLKTKTDLTICTVEESIVPTALEIAAVLRKNGLGVVVDYTNKKIGQKIKNAEKDYSVYVLCLGEEELQNDIYTLKKLADFSEEKFSKEQLFNKLNKEL